MAWAATTSGDDWTDLFDDPVVARGKGVEIKRSQVDNAFIAYRANLALRGQTVPEPLRAQREAVLLEQLIINRLVVNQATEADRVRAKELAVKFMDQLKTAFPSEESFRRRLTAMGLTNEEYDKAVADQALVDAVIEREVKFQITIPEAQVRELYDTGTDLVVKSLEGAVEKKANDPDTRLEQVTASLKRIDELKKANLARLERPETVRVIHLLLATRNRDKDEPYPAERQRAQRELIEKLLARARAGEDFAKLVMEYSEDRALQETKGEYTFTRNAPFATEFKAAAFSLETNQISDVVETQYGYHLIKLLEKQPPQKMDFDQAAPELKELLVSQELQKRLPDFFETLKKEAAIEILDPKYQGQFGKEEPATGSKP